MKRLFLLALTAGTMLVVTSCGSDPAPTTPSTTVDRSSAQATAVAFADVYATGDVPAACELATDQARKGMGAKCGAKQAWSTKVTLKSDCASVPAAAGAEAHSFLFEASDAVFDGESRLRVDVEKPASGSVWSVSSATTPYKGERYSPCLDAQPSSVVLGPTSSS